MSLSTERNFGFNPDVFREAFFRQQTDYSPRHCFFSKFVPDFFKTQNQPKSEHLFADPEPGPSQKNLNYAFTQSMWAEAEIKLDEADLGTGSQEQQPVQHNAMEMEIEKYLMTMPTPADPDGNILAYWKSHAKVVPYLASFAHSILCIPAS